MSRPSYDEGAHFALPGDGDVAEFLDYIEDMTLMLGCPKCRSFDVRESMMCGVKMLVCGDCGFTDRAPKVN